MASKFILCFRHYESHSSIENEKDKLLQMAKTNDFEFVQQYLRHYMKHLTEELDQYTIKLNQQLQQCPITLRSLHGLDDSLKQLVYQQRCYLLKRNEKQVKKFQYAIEGNELSNRMFTFSSTLNQVCIRHRVSFDF